MYEEEPQLNELPYIYDQPDPVIEEVREPLVYWAEDRMGSYYTAEQIQVLREECEENCGEYRKLWPIVAAIGRSENGATRAFGIMNDKADTWRKQAGWCAATVRKNYDRWRIAEPNNIRDINAYIRFLGKRYCPIGADNDPTGLNQHWVKNVTWYTELYTK